MRTKNQVITIAFTASLAACATGPVVDPTPDQGATIQDLLARPVPLVVAVADSMAYLDGRNLPLLAGELEISAVGGTIEIDALRIDLDDMIVLGEDPHLDGLGLRDVHVTLAEPVAAVVEWSLEGDAGFASLQVDLLLDWTLVTPSGATLELATQRLTAVDVELDVYAAADGRLVAALHGGKQGVVWEWAGLVELRDLSFDLRATR
jgi:hypothetical protein